MALINEVIPIQGFDLVGQKIASILLLELTNQINIQSLTDDLGVFLERTNPYDKSEDLMVNVSCNNISYSEFTQRDSQGNTTYYVDVYGRSFETADLSGDLGSRNKLNLYVGFCKYILSCVKYKTLDTGFGLIGGVYVTGIAFDANESNQDGAFIRMARITLSVRIMENQEMDNVLEFTGNDTQIKLSDTDKGQKLIFNT